MTDTDRDNAVRPGDRHRFVCGRNCCGHHSHGLWLSIFVAAILWPLLTIVWLSLFVAIIVKNQTEDRRRD